MQSLVEDVNSAIVAYRQVALRAREMDDPEKAKFAFDCIRRLLLDDFALEYSDYVTLDDVRMEYAVTECDGCKDAIKVGKNVRYDMARSDYGFVPTFVHTNSRKYVTCGKCDESVYFYDRDIFIQREAKSVNFIPHPPSLNNMMSHIYNASKFWTWFDTVWGLAEEKHFQQRQHVSRTEEAD